MEKESCKVVAIEHLTLDGIYQAPARPDEDNRDGFPHGGWSVAGDDLKMQEIISKYMVGGWSLLVGRITYEDLFEGWPTRQPSSPMTRALTSVQKFVVCRESSYKLPWENSVLLPGEATETVAKLKKEHNKPLIIFGSGLLMIHPLVLGQGRRFFHEATPFTKLKLTCQTTTETGVMIANYQAGNF
jgi:dihydrofolate reductase